TPTAASRLLLLTTAGLYLGATSIVPLFDRYLLPLLPMLAVILVPPDRGERVGRRTWVAAALALFALAAYAIAGTHDYLAWNRARWEALGQLAGDGVAANRIDGGLEF